MKQILMFVLFAAVMCWFMFAPVYKHVVIMRQAVLQKEVDFLLEVGASGSRGYIDDSMIAESRQRLSQRGLAQQKIVYEVRATSGASATNPGTPVLRGDGIELTIRYPNEKLFEIDRLVGIEPPDQNGTLSAAGIKMSEYVP